MDRLDVDPYQAGDPEVVVSSETDHAVVADNDGLENQPISAMDGWSNKVDPVDGIPIQAKWRFDNGGKWVAWSFDGESIVASANRLEDLDQAIKQMGIGMRCYEWVDLPGRRVTRL